jgi:hypothetical protein
VAGGFYTLAGIYGTPDSLAITGLLAPGVCGIAGDLLFPSNPHFDGSGVSFTVNGVGDDGLGAAVFGLWRQRRSRAL